MSKNVVVVVYKKRANSKPVIERFDDISLDDILSETKRKPIIDYKYEIIEIGVGPIFEERYKEKYKK
jgi:hypothetical protein